MKVFIYDKKTSKLAKTIIGVTSVYETENGIVYCTKDEEFYVPKKIFKSTAFQN